MNMVNDILNNYINPYYYLFQLNKYKYLHDTRDKSSCISCLHKKHEKIALIGQIPNVLRL